MNWYNSSWLYRKKITIDKDKVGANLTDYPVYLDLSELGSDFFDNVKNGGGDIRITTSDGVTECPREIVSCDTTLKTGEVHALIPAVSSTVDTIVYIYYGNPSASDYLDTDTYGRNAVWGDHQLVAHLKSDLIDSSGNFTLTKKDNATLTTNRFDVANEAYQLDDVDVEYKIQVYSSPNLGEVGDTTYSLWILPTASQTGVNYLLCHYNWRFRLNSSSKFRFIVGRMTDSSGPTYGAVQTDDLDVNSWHRIKGVYHPDPLGGNGYIKLYVDGQLKATTSIGDKEIWGDYSRNLQWGNSNHGASVPIVSKVGETDVYSGIQSDDYILTEYNNQNSPSTFYTIGSQEEVRPLPEPEAGRVSVYINDVRVDNLLLESLKVDKVLDNQRDTASFKIRNTGIINPEFRDVVKVYDGLDLIFSGIIIDTEYDNQSVSSKGVILNIKASDYGYLLEKRLIGKTYNNETIHDIIADMLATNAPLFNADNAQVNIEVDKIVFNQISIATAIQRLADLLNYRWYVDVNKSVHLFEKTTTEAPENLTDTSGNYVYKSLKRKALGAQVVNRIKIRGGEYDGDTFTDSITVSGNASKSFNLPYKMSELTISVNGTPKTVGVDSINDFTSYDVLHNFQNQSFRFESPLSAEDIIEFSGRPKIRVFAISEDSDSKEAYGVQEKIIRENDIKSNSIARKRAAAELYAYAQPLIDAQFFTYNKFLELGMSIKLESESSGADDTLIISKIGYKLIDPMTFGYEIELVSNKRYDLITTLAKLLQPEDLDIDESETSEEIFADTLNVSIQEEHELVTPVEDFLSVEFQEQHLLNAVDPDDIVWVYGYYAPTSDTDPKRMAKFDRDATFS